MEQSKFNNTRAAGEILGQRCRDQQAEIEQIQVNSKNLKKYIWHRRFCKLFALQTLAKKEDCTCGYFEILKALKGE